MQTKFATEVVQHIHAGFSGLWIETTEPDVAQKEIVDASKSQGWLHSIWDFANGTWDKGTHVGDPVGPLKALHAESADQDTRRVAMLHNFHKYLSNPLVAQELANRLIAGKADGITICVLSPLTQIPIEIEPLFTVLEHRLPTKEELAQLACELDPAADPKIAEAAAGLTRLEAENTFALSIVRSRSIRHDEIWEEKAAQLKKSGLLSLCTTDESFDTLKGMDGLQRFCLKAVPTGQARGVLILGVPGTGKSAFAKALGNSVGRPTLSLDLGSMFGSLVGQTEGNIRRALQIADAMAPCVLFVDEIEKGLAGLGSQGDNGTASRLFGTFLTWLNDHKSDVFVIATSNDVSALPPEFTRAERWDSVWFSDLPSKPTRVSIWNIWKQKYIPDQLAIEPPSDEGWTGAEIKACCRVANLLGCEVKEAKDFIIPVSQTAAEKVAALRSWASGRSLDADCGGIYQKTKAAKSKESRRITNRLEGRNGHSSAFEG